MAIFNEILVPRYARGLQKLFGVKGRVPVKQLAGEVAPSFPLFSGRENRFLEGWATFLATAQTNAIAGQDSVVRIRLPFTAKIVAVIEQITADISVGASFFLDGGPGEAGNPPQAAIGDLANVITGYSMDSRFKHPLVGTGGSAASVSWATNIGALSTTCYRWNYNGAINISQNLLPADEDELVLLPGSAFQIRTATLNVALSVSFLWRERVIEESEF